MSAVDEDTSIFVLVFAACSVRMGRIIEQVFSHAMPHASKLMLRVPCSRSSSSQTLLNAEP